MSRASARATQTILLGNEAIGRGLVEAGVQFMTSYPGTPSSEILPSVVAFANDRPDPPYCEWSANEKVAVETALAAAYTGKRSAVAMKQVGLNVALDPVMSAAYIGVIGGFVIISADDPGPHSSQTEQDTRLLAHFAKLPVLDPDGPRQARDLIAEAFALSEKFQIPVVFRPTLRVCHARQNIKLKTPQAMDRPAVFKRDPFRWAAIPKMRLAQHIELNKKLEQIAAYNDKRKAFNTWHRPVSGRSRLGILAGGVAAALARDLLGEMGLSVSDGPLPFLQVAMAYPLPAGQVGSLVDACNQVLVLEETEPVLELLAPGRDKLLGRLNGYVPSHGELDPDRIYGILERALTQAGIKIPNPAGKLISVPDQPPMRRPNLCAGCPHRAVFFAMRRTFAGGIFPSDIGCYTLGLNQGAVDTCHNMGAAISFAAALSRAHEQDGVQIPVAATIGDSTFFHSGSAGLLSAVYNGARFVLIVVDNETTGMTGMQPTPASGQTADGHPGRVVTLEGLIAGCGVQQMEIVDPYDLKALMKALRKARRYTLKDDGGVAVVIARHPCVAHRPAEAVPLRIPVTVKPAKPKKFPVFAAKANPCADCGRCVEICPRGALTRTGKGRIKLDRELCTGCRMCAEVCPTGTWVLEPAEGCVACGLCTTWFSCPALKPDKTGHIHIDPEWCVQCGLCVEVCAHGAIVELEEVK